MHDGVDITHKHAGDDGAWGHKREGPDIQGDLQHSIHTGQDDAEIMRRMKQLLCHQLAGQKLLTAS